MNTYCIILTLFLFYFFQSNATAQITEIPITQLQAKYPFISSIKAVSAEDLNKNIGFLIVTLNQEKLSQIIDKTVCDSAQAIINRGPLPIKLDSIYNQSFILATSNSNEFLPYIDSLLWMHVFSVEHKNVNPNDPHSCLNGHWFDIYLQTNIIGRVETLTSGRKQLVFKLSTLIREYYFSGLVFNPIICFTRDLKIEKVEKQLVFANFEDIGLQNIIDHTVNIRFSHDYAEKKLWCYLTLKD